MNFTSPIRIRGDLQVEIYEATSFCKEAFLARPLDRNIKAKDIGKRLQRMVMRNVITVTGAFTPLISLAQNAGYVAANNQIQVFQVGTSPTPPSRGDTALGSPVGGTGIVTLSDSNRALSPATGQLIVSVSYGSGDADGYTLAEAGLFLGNGSLFAHQVYPSIVKTSAFAAAFSWSIGLTA